MEEAIELCQAAVEVTRPDEPFRATCLANLGNALLSRAEHLTSEADLEAAIEAGQAAVTGWPDDSDHASMVANLDLALRARASYRDQVAGLDRMIESARDGSGEAGELGATGLSDLLLARFSHAGNPADLEEAIRVRRDAITTAADDSERAEHLSGLSGVLRICFLHFGREQDLIDAIAHGRAAVASTSAGDPGLAGRQVSLANALSRRYQSTDNRDDLMEAIALQRSAVAATDRGDHNHPIYLSNLCF
jgi:tetratricopeptide (TPR) repeat protein